MRRAVGVTGELLLTAGLLVLLFVVWQIGVMGVVDGRRQADLVGGIERGFATARPGSPASGQDTRPTDRPPAEGSLADLDPGAPFGVLRVPRLGGSDWARPVLQGVGLDVLARGLGHYAGTALPGQVGNLAIAGHRSGHGNPLIDIDAVQPGDAVVLETRAGWYVYRAVRHDVVAPDRSDVVAPVPERPGVRPTERWLTLTTCSPRYGSTSRYVVFARFETLVPRAAGRPDAVLADPREL